MSGLFSLACFAQAQQADAMFGGSTIMSSGTSACPATGGSCFVTEKGGFYPSISADVIFHKRVGFDFEAAWRGGQGNYAGVGIPFRPILVAFNGDYQPQLSKKAGLDLLGGIGWQTPHFYAYLPITSGADFRSAY